jgi:hypothetical protein
MLSESVNNQSVSLRNVVMLHLQYAVKSAVRSEK